MKKEIILKSLIISLISVLIMFLVSVLVTLQITKTNVKNHLISDAKIYSGILSEDINVINNVDDFGLSRITIIDSTGKVVFESDMDGEPAENHLDREEVQNAINGTPKVVERYSSTFNKKMFYYAVKVNSNGEAYILRIAEGANNVLGYIGTFVLFVFLAMLIALMIAYLFSRQLSLKVVKQMQAIQLSLKSINDGEYKKIDTSMSDAESFAILNEINSVFDITENNIRQIKYEEKKLSYVLDNITQGIFALDKDLNVAFMNKTIAELFKTDIENGKNYIYLVTDSKLYSQINELVSSDGGFFEYEYEDKTLFVNVVSEIKETSSIAYIIIISDITSEKEIIKQKSEFFENASHELKTPLTSMQGLAEIMLAKKTLDSGSEKYIERIYSECKRLNNIVLDMLYISNLENNALEKRNEKINLINIVSEVVTEQKEKADEKNIKTTITGNGFVLADYKNMYELISNIYGNAVNYNNMDGKIDITLTEETDSVKIEIKDTGIGIEKEHLPKLCKRFYRVDKSRSKKSGGTGLGLAIVKHICILYGAKLNITSEIGKGTSVVVEMPNGE